MAAGGTSRKSNKIMTFVLLILAAAFGSFAWEWLFSDDPAGEIEIIQTVGITESEHETSPINTIVTETIDMIPIYLVGAVKKPGIYQIERGTYLYQLVEQAGGLTRDAARDQINLAMQLENNQLIRLPTNAEIAANPSFISNQSEQSTGNKLVDLNHANLDELDSLPGIGPSTARAILDYREKNGSFLKIEDLMKVPGIKESRFNTLRDLVCVKARSS